MRVLVLAAPADAAAVAAHLVRVGIARAQASRDALQAVSSTISTGVLSVVGVVVVVVVVVDDDDDDEAHYSLILVAVHCSHVAGAATFPKFPKTRFPKPLWLPHAIGRILTKPSTGEPGHCKNWHRFLHCRCQSPIPKRRP